MEQAMSGWWAYHHACASLAEDSILSESDTRQLIAPLLDLGMPCLGGGHNTTLFVFPNSVRAQ